MGRGVGGTRPRASALDAGPPQDVPGGPELSPGTPPDEAGRVSGLQCFRGACCLRILYKHEHSAEPVFPFFLILLALV